VQATITIDGDLVVWPENSVECYALERWTAENIKDSNYPRMIIYGDIKSTNRLDLRRPELRPGHHDVIHIEPGESVK